VSTLLVGQVADRRIPRMRWVRIVPLLIMINAVSYIDRFNIGYAIAGGLDADLKFGAAFSGLAGGIFFWGYFVLQFPGGHWAERGHAKTIMTCSLLAWSCLTIGMAFVTTGSQLLVMRFITGIAEGAVFPATYTILGNWFPARETGRASALFITNTAAASLVAGPLSGVILARYDWHMLFVVEGGLSLLLAAAWIPLMSESPAKAKWLGAVERDYILSGVEQDRITLYAAQATGFSWHNFICNRNLWILSAIYLCYHIGNSGFVVWLPEITKYLTGANIGTVGFLSAVPFVFSIIGLYAFGTMSDRTLNRRRYLVVSILAFAACLLVAAILKSDGWGAFTALALSGFFLKPAISLFWTIPKLVFAPQDVGAARGIINGIGNLGGFFGSIIVGYATSQTGDFAAGVFTISAFLLLGAGLTRFLPAITSGASSVAQNPTHGEYNVQGS
jgi:MFS family permease